MAYRGLCHLPAHVPSAMRRTLGESWWTQDPWGDLDPLRTRGESWWTQDPWGGLDPLRRTLAADDLFRPPVGYSVRV